jgi:hypothetical protein
LALAIGQPQLGANVSSQTIYYVPYAHPFVPIYDGTAMQVKQFTSGLSDITGLQLAMAGNAAWPSGGVADVFAALITGVLTLCTVRWTNPTTRATALAYWGGTLTNAATCTAYVSGGTTTTLLANQGTYLGSFTATANGTCAFANGGAASGGSPAVLPIYNHWNQLKIVLSNADNSALYTYSSGIWRYAGASANNSISVLSGLPEVARLLYSASGAITVAGAYQYVGIGINNTTAIITLLMQSQGGAWNLERGLDRSLFGQNTVYALEAGDGAHLNNFNNYGLNTLFVTAPY